MTVLCAIMCIFTIILNLAYFELIICTITNTILAVVKDADFINAVKQVNVQEKDAGK